MPVYSLYYVNVSNRISFGGDTAEDYVHKSNINPIWTEPY